MGIWRATDEIEHDKAVRRNVCVCAPHSFHGFGNFSIQSHVCDVAFQIKVMRCL